MESQLLLLWHRDTLRREDVHTKATDGAVAGGEKRRREEEERRSSAGKTWAGALARWEERESRILAAPQRAAPLHPALLHNSLAWQPNMGFVCMGLWATLHHREDTGDTRQMGRCDHIVCDTPFLLFTRFSSFIPINSPPISPAGLMF